MNPRDLNAQLAQKIKNEKTVRSELRKTFNLILRDYRVLVSQGFIPTGRSAYRYQGAIESILYNHYSRVQRKFKNMVGPDLKQDDQDKEELLALLLLEWKDFESLNAAKAISNTTSDNMVSAYNRAMRDTQEEDLSAAGLAALATLYLRRRLYAREEGISILETQKAAESTKLMEGLVEVGTEGSIIRSALRNGSVEATPLLKTWRTMRDNKVRTPHKLAESQTVPALMPFIVKGQNLMYPGDMSLGATIDNVINCRCTVTYKTK